jgi:hypothetical protein
MTYLFLFCALATNSISSTDWHSRILPQSEHEILMKWIDTNSIWEVINTNTVLCSKIKPVITRSKDMYYINFNKTQNTLEGRDVYDEHGLIPYLTTDKDGFVILKKKSGGRAVYDSGGRFEGWISDEQYLESTTDDGFKVRMPIK